MSEEDDEEDLFFPSHTEEADEGDEGVLSVSPILITSQISAPGNERPVDLTASPPPSGDTPVVDLDASPSGGSPVAEVSTTSSPRNLSPREPSNSVAHRGALTLENSHGADETSAPEEGEAQISGRPSSLTEESHPVLPENIPINEAASTSVPEEEVQILDNFSAVEEPSVPANEAVEPSEEPSAVRESVTPTGIKRKACSDEGNSTKKAKNETEEEDDDNDEGSYCTICFESWTNSGDHRISSLKCGHFFGFVCLDRWLKTGKSCPNCNEKATRKDIRSHYVAKLKAIDTSEQERVKSDLNRLKTEYRKLELDYTSLKVANKMQIEEIERLQKEVAKLYKGAEAPPLLTSSGESSINKPTDTNQSSAGVFKWVYQKRIELVKESAIRGGKLGCRIMTYDANQAMLVVTQPSYTLLAPGFGVRRINMLDLNSNTHSFVGLHKEQIRDLEFNPSNHDQLLSVSQNDVDVFVKPVLPSYKNSISAAVAMCYRGAQGTPLNVTFTPSALGLTHPHGYFVKDLFTNEHLGLFYPTHKQYVMVNPNGVRFLKFSVNSNDRYLDIHLNEDHVPVFRGVSVGGRKPVVTVVV